MSLFARNLFTSARKLGLLALFSAVAGCSGSHVKKPNPTHPPPDVCSFALVNAVDGADQFPLRINEVMTGNDGAWVDERGETDDFIELVNTGDRTILLSDYALGDEPDKATPLPEVELEAGATRLLWADSDPEQGALHLPFKLS